MPKPVGSLTIALALITGAWFGQAYTFFAPINPIQTEDTAIKATVNSVWRFYDAIDILLRTADASALHDVLAPDFVDHVDEPGTPSDRDGLVSYLASLRDTHPSFRLAPQDIVAQGDRVVARLTLTGAGGGTILGVPLAGKEPWPRVDMVRVHEGRIAERWGDPIGYAPSNRLFSETLTFSHHGDLIPMLRRVTVAPEASAVSFTWLGPAIISIESGGLEVTAATRVTSTFEPAFASLQPKTLKAGDSFPVADGFTFTFANRTASTAVFLVLTLVPPGPAGVPIIPDGADTADEAITIQDLAGNTAIMANPGHLSLNLARVTLAPGARLGLHPVAGLEIVVIDAGTGTATIVGPMVSAWLRDTKERSIAAEDSVLLLQGYSLTVSKGASTAYANETAQPTTLLLLTVTSG